MESYSFKYKSLVKQILLGLSASCLLAVSVEMAQSSTVHASQAESTVVVPEEKADATLPLVSEVLAVEEVIAPPTTEAAEASQAKTEETTSATAETPDETVKPNSSEATVETETPAPAETPATTEEKTTESVNATQTNEDTTKKEDPAKPEENKPEAATTEATTPESTQPKAAEPTTPAEPSQITLADTTAYMTTSTTYKEVVPVGTVDPTTIKWTLDNKPISEWKTWNMSKGDFSGDPFITIEDGSLVDGMYSFNLSLESLFGPDLSLRWPNNIRRTYRDYMKEYTLLGTSADGSMTITKKINLRPYENFHTHEEMLAEIEVTKDNAAEDRLVTIDTIGVSAQGRDIKMGIVAKDQESIDHYLNNINPLALNTPEQALKLLQDGKLDYKLPVLINNTHADEQPGIDIVTGLFKDFAQKETISYKTTDKDGKETTVDFRVADLLEQLILLFNFTENPDGDVLNTRALANGLDPNRDTGYQTNPETVAIVTQINKWNPISLLDIHGFVRGFLIEPATPPHDPNFEYDLLSETMLENAKEMGRAGIANSKYTRYTIPKLDYGDGWDDSFSGYTAVYAMYHGILGHTIEIPEGNLESYKAGFFASLAGINFSMENKQTLMENRLKFYARGINKVEDPEAEKELVGADGQLKGRIKGDNPTFFPDYYVIPMGLDRQSDLDQAFRMVEYFNRNGVQVKELTQDTGDYKKGDLVIDMAQAKRGYANHILYQGSNESDWGAMYAELVVNFPIMRGFKSIPLFKSDGLFANKLTDVSLTQAPRTEIDDKAPFYLVENNSLAAVQAINAAIKAGAEIYLAKDGYIMSTETFKTALANFALKGTPLHQRPVGEKLKNLKIYAPGNPNLQLGYNSVSSATNSLNQMGFQVVSSLEEADIVVLDSSQYSLSDLGKKPTIIVGGDAMSQLEALGVIDGFDAEMSPAGWDFEGLLKVLVNKDHKLSSGYFMNDHFYSNSGSWIEAVPKGFESLISVVDKDYYMAGWWPKNEVLAGKVMAIDGTYNDQPMFVYAGNPMNKLHTLYFYRWVSNAIFRGEYATLEDIPVVVDMQEFTDPASTISVTLDVNQTDGAAFLVVKPITLDKNPFGDKSYDAYDIYFINEAGEMVHVNTQALVNVPTRGLLEGIYYIPAEGGAPVRLDFDQEGDRAMFLANHFSIYAMVYKDANPDKPAPDKPVILPIKPGQVQASGIATVPAKQLPSTGTQTTNTLLISGILLASGLYLMKKKDAKEE